MANGEIKKFFLTCQMLKCFSRLQSIRMSKIPIRSFRYPMAHASWRSNHAYMYTHILWMSHNRKRERLEELFHHAPRTHAMELKSTRHPRYSRSPAPRKLVTPFCEPWARSLEARCEIYKTKFLLVGLQAGHAHTFTHIHINARALACTQSSYAHVGIPDSVVL